MPHTYTEYQPVEQPAIGLSTEHGWQMAGQPRNASVNELAHAIFPPCVGCRQR